MKFTIKLISKKQTSIHFCDSGDNITLYNPDDKEHPPILIMLGQRVKHRYPIDIIVNPYKFEEYKAFCQNGRN